MSGPNTYTDEHAAYVGMPEYKHHSVKHTAKQYVDSMTSRASGALLKCGHYGIYHYMSVKHLDRYIGEFYSFHNTADLSTLEFMGQTAKAMVGRNITYKVALTNA